jgi:hypothetical protein
MKNLSNEATQLHQFFKKWYFNPKYSSVPIKGLNYTFIQNNGFAEEVILELQENSIIEKTEGNGYKMTQEAIKNFMGYKN